MFKIENGASRAGVLDDSYWRTIHINSEGQNTCSYQFVNSSISATVAKNNLFELQFSNVTNMQIGLYYGQYYQNSFNSEDEDSQEIGEGFEKSPKTYEYLQDLKLFDAKSCESMVHCSLGGNGDPESPHGFMQLMMSKAEFVNLNLVPLNDGKPMSATLSYRLINSEEHTFILQTLTIMALGFALIFTFISLLFRALNPHSSR